MTGPRSSPVHPHRNRARCLLPFLAAIFLSPLACTNEPTAPQSPAGGPSVGATRLHPYLLSKDGQIAPAAPSSSRAAMSIASASAAVSSAPLISGPKVLILSDVNGPTTTALAASIVGAGFHVGVKRAPEFNWFGSNPAPSGYDVVIHLNGATFNLPLAANAQTALNTFVNNGGGFVGAQWNGSEEAQGQQVGMPNLVLLGAGDELSQNCADCDVTYNVVSGQESHPVLAGIPASFTFHADGHDASPKGDDPATVVLMRVPSQGPAVLARLVGAGKVVNFSFAPNYALTGETGTLTDPRIQQLYINAVRWSSGSPGIEGGGTLDSDADGVLDAADNCQIIENANQSDTDGDALGDPCDPDADGDSVPNDEDNCELYNPDQADLNENWVGDACEELEKQAQTITFLPLPDRTIIDPAFAVSATATSGLAVTFLISGTCTMDGATVTPTAVGTCTIIAQQAGDANWNTAPTVMQSFSITKAPATISVGTEYTYDGTVKQATVSTNPAGLNGLTVTYTLSGVTVANPVNAGVYQVVATLENPNYEAPPANGTLTIHPAVPIVQWGSPAAITAGTALGSTQLNATATGVGGASLLQDFIYLPAEGTVLSAGADQPLSVEFIAADGNYTRVIKTVTITVLPVVVPPPPPRGLRFAGFFRPVYNLPAVNVVQAGRSVPVRFAVEGPDGSQVQPGSPTSVEVSCPAAVAEKGINETVTSQGSRLQRLGSQYTYMWSTNPSWAGRCRKLIVTLVDGSTHEAVFRFVKEPKELKNKRQRPLK
jgi:hypothetical protein